MAAFFLLLAETHAVGASGLGRIALMSANLNRLECAEIGAIGMICTGLYGAMDCFVFVIHSIFLLAYCER